MYAHGRSAVLAPALVPLRISRGLARLAVFGRMFPISMNAYLRAAILAAQVVPLGGFRLAARLAQARRIIPVAMYLN
jgi:hypothetical protein